MAFIDYANETEEERRKRLAEEAAAAATADEAVASGGGAVAPQSVFGQYLDRRLGAIGDRFDQVGQYFTDPEAALQRRLGMQEEAANTEVQTQTVKTYGDGSQERIVKTQMPAPVTGPAVPEQPQMAQLAPQVAMPAPVPVTPVTEAAPQPQVFPAFASAVQRGAQPAAPVIPPEMAQQPVEQPVLPTPGPGVQVASTEAAAGLQAAASARAQQQAQQVAQQAPAATPSLQQQAATAFTPTVEREIQQPITQADRDQMAIVNARNEQDPARRRQAFAQLLGREDVSEGNKALANKFIAEDYLKQLNVAKAERQIAEATPTDLARYMKEQKKEGSYVKAILLARLGLNELAAKEQELLNPTIKAETAIAGDQKYTVFRDKNNNITEAFDINGRSVGQENIAKIMSAAMPSKSFLLPQSAGGLMQKTIIGPDGKEQVITGQVFTDPQTNTTYFQAGNTRYDTSGLSTPAQNVQNVYSAAGARQQGTQAAQTGQGQGALPPMAGAVAAPAGPVAPETTVAAPSPELRRAQGDVAAIDREIAATKPNSPGAQQRLAILNQERAAAQQRVQQAGGPVPGGATGTGGIPQPGAAGGQRPGESFIAYQERLKREGAVAAAAAESNIKLAQEERSNFLDYEKTEIVPKADAAGSISSTRKSQLNGPDGILKNPEIVGLMSGQGGAAAEVGNIIRDFITGARTDDELSQRVASLNLTQRQKDVLYNQIQLNRQIAPKTLKENAGAGSVSDAEQKANRDAAVNVARVPLYTAVTMLSKDQFDKDQSVARQAFRNANPQLGTVRAFNDAWSKEKSRLDAEYNQIYAARAQYIAKYYNDGKNPGAIVDAYKHYPVPEFNRQTGQWDYGTEFARKVARPKISSFER